MKTLWPRARFRVEPGQSRNAVADNDITEISADIGRLKRLRMLDLGHNALTFCAGKSWRSRIALGLLVPSR